MDFRAAAGAVCVAGVLLSSSPSRAAYPFQDDFESGLTQWATNGAWGITAAASVSPTRSATDSPGALYGNNQDATLSQAAGMNLGTAVRPALSFQHRHVLESGYDFGRVEVSPDGGASWTNLAAYTGNLSAWTREQFDLTAWAGRPDVRVRFRLVTDGSVIMDGWYVDDVRVDEAPAAVTLAATSAAPNAVSLTWTPSADPRFAKYVILRSLSPAFDWHTASVVAEFPAAATTSTVDIAVGPKTVYRYAAMVLTTNGLHSLSPVAAAATPAGMDYPFLDNAEGGGGTWIPDPNWAISDEAAFSATHAWSDSPGTNYGDSINAALTLSAPLDLRGRRMPAWSFTHRYAILGGDLALAEISTNAGANWAVLKQFTGATVTNWTRERLSLAPYTNAASALVRFRLTTDASGGADGWQIDDISVADSPDAVDVLLPSEVSSHTMRVSWPQNTNLLFSHYAVVRGTAAGLGINSAVVTNIAQQGTTTFVDSGLALDTVYYYRVYAVSLYGTYSPDGGENSARTLNHPIPFADDFEGSLAGWNFTGLWGATTNSPHGGGVCLADSPSGGYANSADTWAQTAVNLLGSTWPVLRFWDRCSIATPDWGWVEVSSDGSSWTRVYGINGVVGDWTERRIDLSPWRQQTNVRIRFRMWTDGSTTADGWSIDDVSVTEHTPAAHGLPFVERFEQGLTNWIAARWMATTNVPKDGTQAAVDTAGTVMSPDTQQAMTLGGALDLSGTTNPQLTFWVRGTMWDRSRFRVQVSTDNGVSWPDVYWLNNDFNAGTAWQRAQVSLSGYRVANVRLRLITWAEWSTQPDMDVYVDKLTIEEMPAPVVLQSAAAGLKTIDLGWTPSTLPGFATNLVYRSTDATVDLNDTLIGAFTDPNVTNLTDAGRSIGATYWYRIYTVNTNGTYTPSNDRSATTVPIAYPFTDGMETAANWDATGSWGVSSNSPHGGGACLADSPSGDYNNSSDTYILTAVNLLGSTWPVLTFWDRCSIATPDWGWVEVSTDGSGWTRVYGINGVVGGWTERRIDLSPWRQQPNLRIRFRMWTDGSATADGWSIDDVSVTEHTPAAYGLPFVERFEQGLTNWITARWTATTNVPKDGALAAMDTAGTVMSPDTQQAMTLGGALDLSGTTNPQLTLWVRGTMWDRSRFRVQVSTDNGVSWPDVYWLNNDFNAGTAWQRAQVSLSGYRVANVRLRLITWAEWSTQPDMDVYVDKLTIEEMPAPVVLQSATPGLKTIDLGWTPSTMPGFATNLVYRSTDATVDLNDTLIGAFTDPNVTNLTDAGRSIGATYWYRVYTVNTNGTYTPSNDRSATTVPIAYPFTDGMETAANWDATGSWGVSSNSPHGGGACLSDSPSGDYNNSSDTYILTAVNLLGSTWPVLRFWDRCSIATPDWGWVEVSSDGSSWTRVYGINGVVGGWTERRIDLSPWRQQPNLRIRFRMWTDGSATADGWSIDDVSVTELSPASYGLPFVERFEQELTNWITARWTATTNVPKDGALAAMDAAGTVMSPDTQQAMTLGGALDLSGTTNPQLTFWMRGTMWDRSRFRVQVSTDNGVSWPDVYWLNNDFNAGTAWQRVQVSLSGYRVANVRLRLITWAEWSTQPDMDVYVDKITIEETPMPVVLNPPDQVGIHSMRLTWVATTNPGFAAYLVYRSTATGVSDSSPLIATFTNIADTAVSVSGLQSRATYYYRVYVQNTNDTRVGSGEASARTLGVSVPWLDTFETNQPGWTYSGAWGPMAGAGRGGGAALTDSPGDYSNSSDSSAMMAVSLVGMTWPVLRFAERVSIAENDWGWVEVSSNDGANWTRIYGVYGSRTNWAERALDLSPWKNQSSVWIRFRLYTDGGTTADGWYIDDVGLAEHPAPAPAASFYDDFEASPTNAWIRSTWGSDTNSALGGAGSIRDTPFGRISPDTAQYLCLGAPLDLSGTTNPVLTCWIRGALWDRTRYRTQVSTDGGINWTEIHGFNNDWNQSAWQKVQVSLAAYRSANVRLRFVTWSEWGTTPDIDLYLDRVGIGEQPPGAPVQASPVDYASINDRQPMLVVTNATDFQSDSLTYRFEVYDDEGLSGLVAMVPSVAGQAVTTSWKVDVQLPNNAQYWWRTQANDGSNGGPWMATATFYINETNAPPSKPVVAGPPPASILENREGQLAWWPSDEPDAGDRVAAYHVQIAPDTAFTNPVVDDATLSVGASPTGGYWAVSIALDAMSGSAGLATNTTYYWRVRGLDARGGISPWSDGAFWFYFGIPPPDVMGMEAMAGGAIAAEVSRTSRPVTVEFTRDLVNPDWQPVTVPVVGTNVIFQLPPGEKNGFFRIVTE